MLQQFYRWPLAQCNVPYDITHSCGCVLMGTVVHFWLVNCVLATLFIVDNPIQYVESADTSSRLYSQVLITFKKEKLQKRQGLRPGLRFLFLMAFLAVIDLAAAIFFRK